MGSLGIVDVAFALWIVVGCGALVFMIRHGHNPVRWAILSFALGPFVVIPALIERLRSRRVGASVVLDGSAGPGNLSVVVGLDGSPASQQALRGAISIFGDRIETLTLASVIDFEAARAKKETWYRSNAEDNLSRGATIVSNELGMTPTAVILAGNPANALLNLATEQGLDWIVIGTRGTGDTEWLYGSTAAALAAAAAPVVIIGGHDARGHEVAIPRARR